MRTQPIDDRRELGFPPHSPKEYPMPLPPTQPVRTIGGHVHLDFYSNSTERVQFRSKVYPAAPIVALDRKVWENMGSPEKISISWGTDQYFELGKRP